MKFRSLLLGLSFLLAPALASPAVAPPVALAESFSLADVRLLDGPFKRAEELNRAYLLSLDPDRLLYSFRVNAGLPTTARPYGGWEAMDWDFHGHTLGHYLSACAQMAARGDEPEFQRRVDYIVAELAHCQAALARSASHPGFLDPQPEAVFARLEQGEGGVGVPYYTMHKTFAGLLDAATLAHSRQALQVATGLAAWLKDRLDVLSDAQVQTALRIEHGGIAESAANLYALTGNPDHLRLSRRLTQQAFVQPFARGEDPLGPGPAGTRLIHANTQVPKAIAAAREYEVTGDSTARDVATNFWRDVALTRSFVIGGNSDGEHFFARGTEARHLSARTAEFCNTYNMLKLTRHLLAWSPTSELSDFYERALYNHVLAAQNPETGMGTYFTSLEPGGRKRFATPDNTFWCCTGTAMEMNSKLADTIYLHGADTLYVNLFIASELRWRAWGLVLRQLTHFPESDTTELVFHLDRPRRFAVKLRCPAWCAHVGVRVNGNPAAVSIDANGYATFDRTWAEGDRVSVHLPMTLQAASLPDDPSLLAFVYGPIVLAGDLGDKGLRFKPDAFVDNGKDPRGPRPAEWPQFVPGLIGSATDVASHVRRVEGEPLQFRTVGIGRPNDVTLVPLYAIVNDAYSVYWRRYEEPEWDRTWAREEPKVAQRAAAADNVVDAVWAGIPRSEAAHDVAEGGAPVVSSRLSLYREATNGWVSWKLETGAAAALTLRVGFLGDRTAAFDVLLDGSPLVRERPVEPAGVTPNRATVTTIKTYGISPERLAGKSLLEVRFVGQPSLGPARIVFCELSRSTPAPRAPADASTRGSSTPARADPPPVFGRAAASSR